MKKKILILVTVIIFNSSFLILNCPCQWVQTSGPIGAIARALIASSGTIFSGGLGVSFSTNNGTNWTQTALNYRSIFSLAVNENNIFAGTYYSGVYFSTNNGTTWTQTTLNNQNVYYVYSLAISGNNIFAGTSDSGVYLSTNNGITWTRTALNNISVYSLTISGNNIFAGTNLIGVYHSTNNGTTWTQTSLDNRSILSLTISGNNIFAGTSHYGVYLSTNNGTTWTQTSLNNISVYSLVISGNNIFAGTSHYGVYLSTNNGINWIPKNEGFGNLPLVLSLLLENEYIFAGTNGQYVWRRFLSEMTDIKNISKEVPSSFSLEQNYPNPFNAVTSIKFKVTSEGGRSQKTEVRLKVYDLMGREVRTLVDERLEAGVYEVRFDAGNLPSGVYFYRMEAGRFSETKKMLLTK